MLHLAGLAVLLFLLFKVFSLLMGFPYLLSLKKDYSDLKVLRRALRVQASIEQVVTPLLPVWKSGKYSPEDFFAEIARRSKNEHPQNELAQTYAALTIRQAKTTQAVEHFLDSNEKVLAAARAVVNIHLNGAHEAIGDETAYPVSGTYTVEELNQSFENALAELGAPQTAGIFSSEHIRNGWSHGWHKIKSWLRWT